MSRREVETQLAGVTAEAVREFWQANPLCATGIPHPLGSPEFFASYDAERESIESVEFSRELHEYSQFVGKSVLDVGCGNGYVLGRYAFEGALVTGVDVTDAAIALTQRRFVGLGLSGNFRVADAQSLPFEDGTFDCVCSMGVLHHVPRTDKAVAEIFRVLKPGGRLIVMFYHRHSAKYQWKYRVWHWFTGKAMQQLVNEFDGVGNPKGVAYSRAELRQLLARFDEVRLRVGYLETRDIVLRGARFLPKDLFRALSPTIGWNLYAKARKPR